MTDDQIEKNGTTVKVGLHKDEYVTEEASCFNRDAEEVSCSYFDQ